MFHRRDHARTTSSAELDPIDDDLLQTACVIFSILVRQSLASQALREYYLTATVAKYVKTETSKFIASSVCRRTIGTE
jgi:hypothetical protein